MCVPVSVCAPLAEDERGALLVVCHLSLSLLLALSAYSLAAGRLLLTPDIGSYWGRQA